MKKHLTLLGVAAVATAVLAGCSNDELVESYQGEEISFRTRVETRATETTINNLTKFKVWGDAKGYPTFFLTGGTATKDENNDNIYNLTKEDGSKVYWPSGIGEIHFWAYGPSDIAITPNIDRTGQQLTGYTLATEIKEGGKAHKDLIVAHTLAKHGANGTSVKLDFKHALSNIRLNLKSGDASKFMRVKGAWFVNAKNSGDIRFVSDTNPIEWSVGDNFACYGVTFDGVSTVNTSPSQIIANGKTVASDLMLIPQTVDMVKFTPAADGAYILLLCQIMAVHPGATHEEDGTSTAADDEKHYHQLFPEKEEVIGSESEFTNEFGYTCVPVNISWEAGKKYTYTLEFCGKTSGGGLYPPANLPDDLPKTGEDITIISRPKDKNPGNPVLDNPISFEVSVGPWENAESGDGNVNMQ